jgi:hypothetical protein
MHSDYQKNKNKNKKYNRAGRRAQGVDCLSKHEAPSSSPSTAKINKYIKDTAMLSYYLILSPSK